MTKNHDALSEEGHDKADNFKQIFSNKKISISIYFHISQVILYIVTNLYSKSQITTQNTFVHIKVNIIEDGRYQNFECHCTNIIKRNMMGPT